MVKYPLKSSFETGLTSFAFAALQHTYRLLAVRVKLDSTSRFGPKKDQAKKVEVRIPSCHPDLPKSSSNRQQLQLRSRHRLRHKLRHSLRVQRRLQVSHRLLFSLKTRLQEGLRQARNTQCQAKFCRTPRLTMV